MIKIVSPFLIRILTNNFAKAIAIFPFVIFKHRDLLDDLILINHEKIHLKQQLECLLFLFYIIYVFEYIKGRIDGNSHYDAYRKISFESEAFENEKKLNYLKQRNKYAWLKFL